MEFILASASPRRVELLKTIGLVPSHIAPMDVDETPLKGELPEAYVIRIAKAKAEKANLQFPEHAILSADTTVACGRSIFGKAEDVKTAQKYLTHLSGKRHRVYTAVAFQVPEKPLRIKTCMTQVKFNRLSKTQIDNYIDIQEWQGKAGAYAIQGAAAAFIPWINGSYSNVVGLPLHIAALFLNTSPLPRGESVTLSLRTQ